MGKNKMQTTSSQKEFVIFTFYYFFTRLSFSITSFSTCLSNKETQDK